MAKRAYQYLVGSPLQQMPSAYVEKAILKGKMVTPLDMQPIKMLQPQNFLPGLVMLYLVTSSQLVDPGRLLTCPSVLHRRQASQSRGQPKGDCFEGSHRGDCRSGSFVTIESKEKEHHTVRCHAGSLWI